jgi:predicted enzyme related to lactoylglutathione lyase
MARFFHHQLRTTDVPRARAFYTSVLGRDGAEIFELHEHAIARGARPHWLGHIAVEDVDAAAAAFAARGATPLGPKWLNPQGLEAAVLRDPGGAVVALSRKTGAPPPEGADGSFPEVTWHELNTMQVERARANYAESFGWDLHGVVDLGVLGVIHPFAWRPGERAAGSMSDVAGRPGVHPHWLFHFRVGALGPALLAVRAGGGSAMAPLLLPNGDRVAVCDDPQGAAFALREVAGTKAP